MFLKRHKLFRLTTIQRLWEMHRDFHPISEIFIGIGVYSEKQSTVLYTTTRIQDDVLMRQNTTRSTFQYLHRVFFAMRHYFLVPFDVKLGTIEILACWPYVIERAGTRLCCTVICVAKCWQCHIPHGDNDNVETISIPTSSDNLSVVAQVKRFAFKFQLHHVLHNCGFY